MVDILDFVADKDQITTEEIVSHFGFNPTTAKRYLRQLTEFGYLEAHGGNKNRTYSIISLLRKTAITWRNKKFE
jgi:DNA-binding IclR family transcriptional regulator